MTNTSKPTEAQIAEAVRVLRIAGTGLTSPKGGGATVSYAQVRKAERTLAAAR